MRRSVQRRTNIAEVHASLLRAYRNRRRRRRRRRSSRGRLKKQVRGAFHCSDNNSINATARKQEEEHEKEANEEEE